MTDIRYIQSTERQVGEGHPTLSDTLNRPLRDVLTASGVDPDADFTGFASGYANASIKDASAFSGATADVKIMAAHDALPSTGGVIDARGLVGAQTISTALTLTKPVLLRLSPASTYTANTGFAVVTGDNVTIEGNGAIVHLTRAWNDGGDSIVAVITATAVAGFRVHGLDLRMTITGSDDSTVWAYVGILIQDNAGHTVGSTNFSVDDNTFTIDATQPSTSQRSFGVLCWTNDDSATPARVTGSGVIRGNRVLQGGSRTFECSLCTDVAITGNSLSGLGHLVDCPTIRIIGCQSIAVVGNTIRCTDSTAVGFTGVTIGGDNQSQNITVVGNSIYSEASDGTGIIVRGDPTTSSVGGVERVVISGNNLFYNGDASTTLTGIKVLQVSSVALDNILITGNYLSGWTRAQTEVTNSGSVDPTYVSIRGNFLGMHINGSTKNPYTGNVSLSTDRVEIINNAVGFAPHVGGRSDADCTLTPLNDYPLQEFKNALTATRTVTLSTTNAQNGDTFTIVRTTASTGLFGLNVGGLITLWPGQWCTVAWDSTAWIVKAAGMTTNRGLNPAVSADNGDTSPTFTVGLSAPTQVFATILTANRTVTLSTTNATNGCKFRVVRTGLGAFTLDVGGLKTIGSATAAFVDVEYNGSAWILTGYGAL